MKHSTNVVFTGKRYYASEPDSYTDINPRTGMQYGEIPSEPKPKVVRCDFCRKETKTHNLDEFGACPECHLEPQAMDGE